MRIEDELLHELERLYPRIERSVRAYTAGTGLDAEDLTQETFLKAVKNLDGFSGDASVYTWLFRIARNTCIDAMRKLKNRRKYETDTGDRIPEPVLLSISDEDGKDDVERRESVRLLRDAVAGLPDEYRELVIFKEIEGMKYHEISTITDLPEGTIKSRLFRARVLLKNHLMKAGYNHEA